MLRAILEISVGVLMLGLGILFFLYIPTNALNLATNVIFIGAGVLVIKRAITMFGKTKTSHVMEDKTKR